TATGWWSNAPRRGGPRPGGAAPAAAQPCRNTPRGALRNSVIKGLRYALLPPASLGSQGAAPYIARYRGREAATICGHGWPARLRLSRGPRTRDERQSAQFRPVGDHCPAAPCPVHAVSESWSAHDIAGHFLLAAL